MSTDSAHLEQRFQRIVGSDFRRSWAPFDGAGRFDRQLNRATGSHSTNEQKIVGFARAIEGEILGVGIAKTFHFNELEDAVDVNAMTILLLSRGLPTNKSEKCRCEFVRAARPADYRSRSFAEILLRAGRSGQRQAARRDPA